jgi:hypothetical protein
MSGSTYLRRRRRIVSPVPAGKRPDDGLGGENGPLALAAVVTVGQVSGGAQEGRIAPVAALDAIRDAQQGLAPPGLGSAEGDRSVERRKRARFRSSSFLPSNSSAPASVAASYIPRWAILR